MASQPTPANVEIQVVWDRGNRIYQPFTSSMLCSISGPLVWWRAGDLSPAGDLFWDGDFSWSFGRWLLSDLQRFGDTKVTLLESSPGSIFCCGGGDGPGTDNKGWGEDDEISGGCVCWKWRVFETVMLNFSKLSDISPMLYHFTRRRLFKPLFSRCGKIPPP